MKDLYPQPVNTAFLKLWCAVHLWFSRSALVVLQKNTEEKLKFKWIAENLRVWKWHMAIAFPFSPSTGISWNLLHYPSTDFPPHSQQQNRDLKHYQCGVSRHLFPAHLAPCLWSSQTPPKFIPKAQSTEPFHVFTTFLNVLQTPSLHIKMVLYCMSYTNNKTCQIAYNDRPIGTKICY